MKTSLLFLCAVLFILSYLVGCADTLRSSVSVADDAPAIDRWPVIPRKLRSSDEERPVAKTEEPANDAGPVGNTPPRDDTGSDASRVRGPNNRDEKSRTPQGNNVPGNEKIDDDLPRSPKVNPNSDSTPPLESTEPKSDQADPDMHQEVLTRITELLTQNSELLKNLAAKDPVEQPTIAESSVSAEYERKLTAVLELVQDLDARVNQAIKPSQDRSGQGIFVADILNAMDKSPAYRDEIQKVVDLTMSREATLRVRNDLAIGQWFCVGSETHCIAPGETKTFRRRPGNVTTELVGHEAPRNWMLGPPDFDLLIVIGHR